MRRNIRIGYLWLLLLPHTGNQFIQSIVFEQFYGLNSISGSVKQTTVDQMGKAPDLIELTFESE